MLSLAKDILLLLLPWAMILSSFIMGLMIGKIFLKRINKIVLVAAIILSLIAFYFANYLLFSFILGIITRIVIKLLTRIKAKGSIHKKSHDFYIGKSKSLHNKYDHSLDHNVVKSTLIFNHQLIYGVSGAGKTFSTLNPQCYFDIKWGRRVFVIDPKGDLNFSDYIYSCCIHFDRKDQFFFFSLTNPAKSQAFNPLKGITDNEIKDLIISCTEWSEPYYKKMAEVKLLEVLKKVEIPTLSKIESLIPDEMEFKGLKADLKILAMSDFGALIDQEDAPSISELHEQNKVCFFAINTQAYPEASKQIGRIILGSLMALSNKIQSCVDEDLRKETSVVIDEFGSFITETFINFLNKARSSKFRLILATQSPGDLENQNLSMRQQIADSTKTKMILMLGDPESAEYCSNMIGTHTTKKRTSRVDDRNFIADTRTGSEREVQEFVVHPDQIKELNVGEGFVFTQAPFSVTKVKFNFSKYFQIKIHKFLDEAVTLKKKGNYVPRILTPIRDFPTELIEEVN